MAERNGGIVSEKTLHALVIALTVALIGNGFVVWRDQAVMENRMDKFDEEIREIKWQIARHMWRSKYSRDDEKKTRSLTIPDLRRDP